MAGRALKSGLIIYWSSTRNTEKVVYAIKEGLESSGLKIELKRPQDAAGTDFFDYDLVCVGSPSIKWQPAKPIADFLKGKMAFYPNQGKIKPCTPKVEGKNALIFCTFSRPHTGINEAIPAGKTMRQFFEHFVFNVVGGWYVPSEFNGREDLSTQGRLGKIRGKPTPKALAKIKKNAEQLAERL